MDFKKQNITFVLQSIYDISDKSKEIVSLKIIHSMQDYNLRFKQIFNLLIKTTEPLYLTNVSIEILNNAIYHLGITVLY